ncbi:MAG: hypothetical protein ACREMZ_12855 [Gemmatimonadales bacterium]
MNISKFAKVLGDLEGHVSPTASAVDYSAYAGRPVAFAVEVLKLRLLAWQKRWLEAFHGFGQHATRSANGCGKTALTAVLLIYVALALRGTAIYFSASEKQTRTQMKTLLAQFVDRVDSLAADVYNHGCVFTGAGAIVLANAGDFSAMQGHHGATLCIVADEAQALEDEQLAALQGCTVGDNNWLCLMGNPLMTGGPFHKVSTTGDPSWRQTKVTAIEVAADPEAVHIIGLITQKGINNLRQTWGEESSQFQSRVMAEFPAQHADAMFPEEAIAAAFRRYHDADYVGRQSSKRLTIGVDVGASSDGDASALAVAKGGYVRELILWHEADTMKTVGKVIEHFRRFHVTKQRHPGNLRRENALLMNPIGYQLITDAMMQGDPLDYSGMRAEIRVDEIGCGKGVADRLKEAEYPCVPFNASKRPSSEENQKAFANLRAEAYSRFRTKLINGDIALPYSPELEQEMRTCCCFTNSSGRLQIISKQDWRPVLGRSPDRLDSVVMATAADGVRDFSGTGEPAVL